MSSTDSFPAEHFNAAFDLAKNNSIQVAYSNQAFELWYLLHFNYLDAGISRQAYIERLGNKDCLGHPYEKNSIHIYDELLDRQPTAIARAEHLLAQYQSARPEQDNPSTTVHLLVQELNRFSR